MLRGTLVGLMLLAIAAITLPRPAGAETRIALVIGNSAYPSGPLASPKDDAEAIESKLKVLGFQVNGKTDLGREGFFNAIREFGNLLQQSGTVGLFYYSGHGMQVNNRNYMIPIDADIRSEVDVARYAVPVDDVLGRMELGKSNPNIVILDACRNNPFEKRFKSSQDGLALMDAPASTLIAFAAAPGRVAEAGSGGTLSLYTAALAEHIDQPYPNFIELFRTVQNAVYKRSGRNQSPRLELSPELPDFSFKPVVATIPSPASTTAAAPSATNAMSPETLRLRVEKTTTASKPAEATAAGTDTKQQLGTFRNWTAVSQVDGKNQICYFGAQPQKQEQSERYMLVTHRPSTKVIGEVSVRFGYTHKEGTDAEASIDGKSFKLFTRGDKAWAYDAAEDRALVSAMKAGEQLVLKGTPDKGPSTIDTYLLAGFSRALEAINKACGVSGTEPD